MMDIKKVLSIAGSDSSGGAGIQADIKTIMANGCYAMTAITALTAQNTLGVFGIEEASGDFLRLQLETVCDDIIPDAVKVGMVSSPELISVICEVINTYQLKNVVVDPVMVSTSGSRLLKEDAMDVLVGRLLPLADVITPNIPETELLTGLSIKTSDDMIEAARKLYTVLQGRVSVLVKGGHSINDANDLLILSGSREDMRNEDSIPYIWIEGERIETYNTHGTGCTLSSAIASFLARDYSVEQSVRYAKAYISEAMKNDINIGHGSGPLNHGYRIINMKK